MTQDTIASGVPVSGLRLESPRHSFEQRCSPIESFDAAAIERLETFGKRTHTSFPATQQQPSSARGSLDPCDPLVRCVRCSSYEPVLLERLDKPRHCRRPHLLGSCQIAERDWAAKYDHRQGRKAWRAQAPLVVLPPQGAQQPNSRRVDPVGNLCDGWFRGLAAFLVFSHIS